MKYLRACTVAIIVLTVAAQAEPHYAFPAVQAAIDPTFVKPVGGSIKSHLDCAAAKLWSALAMVAELASVGVEASAGLSAVAGALRLFGPGVAAGAARPTMASIGAGSLTALALAMIALPMVMNTAAQTLGPVNIQGVGGGGKGLQPPGFVPGLPRAGSTGNQFEDAIQDWWSRPSTQFPQLPELIWPGFWLGVSMPISEFCRNGIVLDTRILDLIAPVVECREPPPGVVNRPAKPGRIGRVSSLSSYT